MYPQSMPTEWTHVRTTVESESANLLIFKRTAQQFCHLANENILQPITF